MLKPSRPSYSEFVSQLQNFDQRRNWFPSHTDMTNIIINNKNKILIGLIQLRSLYRNSYSESEILGSTLS
jgi:hypothetical protein